MTVALSARAPSVVRTAVPRLQNYQGYREYLRLDFWYSCAYCSIAESEALGGLAFEIEHYVPQAEDATLVAEYSNLMWACAHCNDYKSSLVFPSAAVAAGVRLFRPDIDVHVDHFELNENSVDGRSEIGVATERLLALNRKTLRDLRAARRELADSESAVLQGLQALAGAAIDELPKPLRARIQRLRVRAAAATDELTSILVKALNHSQFADNDADKPVHQQARQDHLENLKVLYPGSYFAKRSKAVP